MYVGAQAGRGREAERADSDGEGEDGPKKRGQWEREETREWR
jgi:hypothetical protein